MIWLAGALAAALCAAPQTPSAELRRSLSMGISQTRYSAAVELAQGDEDAEEWILKQVDKGTPERQRALLLACALMGTEDTLAEVEEVARRGSRNRPDAMRAYALLLYGAYHPEAGADPEADWKRAVSAFERTCLLTGLLRRPEPLADEAWVGLVAEDARPEHAALLRMAAALRGELQARAEEDSSGMATRLLLSVLPGMPAVRAGEVAEWERRLPRLWLLGARRDPARGLDDLRRVPAAGEGRAVALSLYEVAPDDRQDAFDFLRGRVVDAEARAWLWGAAGEFGLDLPPPAGEALVAAEVAGILALHQVDAPRAVAAARLRHQAARTVLTEATLAEERWPAALLLALVLAHAPDGEEKAADLELLRGIVVGVDGAERARLQPAWSLANGRLQDAATLRHWLGVLARSLGAGGRGYLDSQAHRWVGYLLVGGTQAAEERQALADPFPELEGLAERDYTGDNDLYRDLADFLGGSYRFALDAGP